MVENQEVIEECGLAPEQVAEFIERFSSGKAPALDEQGMICYVFANDRENPALYGLLNMLYEGCFKNTVGITVAKNSKTGNEETLFVGLEKTENTIGVIPFARMLSKEETAEYMPPDEVGGYIDYRNAE